MIKIDRALKSHENQLLRVRLNMLWPREQDILKRTPVKIWKDPDGARIADFYRDGTQHRIRFLGLGDFYWEPDRPIVTCLPISEKAEAACRDIFATQVYPLLCSTQGHLVLHASVVAIDGAALLFAGPSGRGKSTLASQFARMGHEIMDDDVAVLRRSKEGILVEPGDGSVRLWEDSATAVRRKDSTAAKVHYNDKVRISGGVGMSVCEEALPLAAVIHLGDPSTGATSITPLSASAAFSVSFKNMFVFDDGDAEVLSAHFEQITDLAARLPHYHMVYPRSYDALGDVCDEIVNLIRSE